MIRAQLFGVAIAATLTLVAACSNDDADGGDDSSTDAPAAVDTGGTDSADSAAGNTDVCSLLTIEEVEEWTGLPRAEPPTEAREGFGGRRICTWWTDGDPDSLALGSFISVTLIDAVEEGTARRQIEALLEASPDGEVLADVDGIPGEVFLYESTSDNFTLGTIIRDDLVVEVDARGDSLPTDPAQLQQIQVEALDIALGRLGVS